MNEIELLELMQEAHRVSHGPTTMRELCNTLNDLVRSISMYDFRNVDGYRNTVYATHTTTNKEDDILIDLNRIIAERVKIHRIPYVGIFKWNKHHEMIIFELTSIGAMDQKDMELVDVLSI